MADSSFFSLDGLAGDVFTFLGVEQSTKAQIAASQAQADASRANASLSFLNATQVQYLLIAVVVSVVAIAIIKSRK